MRALIKTRRKIKQRMYDSSNGKTTFYIYSAVFTAACIFAGSLKAFFTGVDSGFIYILLCFAVFTAGKSSIKRIMKKFANILSAALFLCLIILYSYFYKTNTMLEITALSLVFIAGTSAYANFGYIKRTKIFKLVLPLTGLFGILLIYISDEKAGSFLAVSILLEFLCITFSLKAWSGLLNRLSFGISNAVKNMMKRAGDFFGRIKDRVKNSKLSFLLMNIFGYNKAEMPEDNFKDYTESIYGVYKNKKSIRPKKYSYRKFLRKDDLAEKVRYGYGLILYHIYKYEQEIKVKPSDSTMQVLKKLSEKINVKNSFFPYAALYQKVRYNSFIPDKQEENNIEYMVKSTVDDIDSITDI